MTTSNLSELALGIKQASSCDSDCWCTVVTFPLPSDEIDVMAPPFSSSCPFFTASLSTRAFRASSTAPIIVSSACICLS